MSTPSMAPYGEAGSGWSGSASSRERQEREDSLGRTAYRQREALRAIAGEREAGRTTGELEAEYGWHHGQSSSALTHLHRAGHVVRLTERRNGQEIYVCPDYAAGRELAPYNPRTPVGRKHPRFTSDADVQAAMQEAAIPINDRTYKSIRDFLDALP